MSSSDLARPPDAPAAEEPVAPVTFSTPWKFLIGNRAAILFLAGSRGTLGLGAIFVLSAGLAREYDGEDLLAEPWHLALPLGASLATSFVLFFLVSFVAALRGAGVREFGQRYVTFLGLYWMTAPLAWLYAIPVERFLSAGAATEANLYLLAIVSLWRVVLITRVLSVLLRASAGGIFFVVMLFADTVALLLVQQIDVQLFAVMGGVRLTEAEKVLAGTKLLVMVVGVLSWPIWLTGTAVVASRAEWEWHPGMNTRVGRIPISLWLTAAAAVVVWLIPMPWTQAEQQLRGSVERAFRAGRYEELLATMSDHDRHDFPPHWDPPPRIGAGRERPRILEIVSALKPSTAPWVRQVFVSKFSDALGRGEFVMHTLWTEADVDRILMLIQQLPEGPALLEEKQFMLQYLSDWSESAGRSQRLAEFLMKSAKPPNFSGEDEYASYRFNEYVDEYLTQLEKVDNRGLVLAHHESHLKGLLNQDANALADGNRERIQKLLNSGGDQR